MAGVDLDIAAKHVRLHVPGKYALDVATPVPVCHEAGGAKFKKKKGKLVVTVPVDAAAADRAKRGAAVITAS